MDQPHCKAFFVTGTDTDVGKTIVSALSYFAHLDADYWKPVQAGTEAETNSVTVRRLAEVSADRILPEAYVLPSAMAPHEAARRAGVYYDIGEAHGTRDGSSAGGRRRRRHARAPHRHCLCIIDLASELQLPVLLVARSTLGTINHTLLSIEALRRRGLPLAGVVINGPETPHNRVAIERYGDVDVIAEIPWLPSVTRATLLEIEPELDLEKLARAET